MERGNQWENYMSVSKSWISNPENVEKVLHLYKSKEILRVIDIADRLGTTEHNIQAVIRQNLPEAERKALAALRYSMSKVGAQNPMHGKFREQHHNWKGQSSDCKGYLTTLNPSETGPKRLLQHRAIFAEALGVSSVPLLFEVHHIDGNGENNSLDNLALVTPKAHKKIHQLQKQDPKWLESKKSTLAQLAKSMI
jgi:hypothetical protein